MNLQLALSMTAAKPIPNQFDIEQDQTSCDGSFPKNLNLVQEAPPLEILNSNTAYSGTPVDSSNFNQASSFRLAESHSLENQPKVNPDDVGAPTNCCAQNEASNNPAECKCGPNGQESGSDSIGDLKGQADGQTEGQSGREQAAPHAGVQEAPPAGEQAGHDNGRDSPGIWQLYVEPWICEHVPWKSC